MNLQKIEHIACFLIASFIWVHNLSDNLNLEEKTKCQLPLPKNTFQKFYYKCIGNRI